MANIYNRWAPTQRIGLPVDYYQSALMLKDQRAQESVDKIEGIANQYAQIQAVSPDAEALYNETMDKLRSGVEALSKEKLDTPEAQRRAAKLFKDPEIVSNLDKVYSDAMYAAEARKNLNEYLKKNPQVNAVDYLTAFNKLGTETGDSSKFNPDRFKNMPALTDYYDVNKLIADEVKSLKANEEEVKKIVGDKYQTYKETGVLEDRIRELARDRVLADPQAYSQFQRNTRYQNFLADPYDPENGMRKNASSFRAGIGNQQISIQKRIDDLAKGRKDEEIKKKEPQVYEQIQQGRAMMKQLGRYTSQSNGADYDVSDDQIVSQMGMDNFVKSYDAYAWKTRKQEEEWTPMALAEFNARQAMARLRTREALRKKTLQDIFNPEVQHLTIPGTAEQIENSPENWNDYISHNIPGLNVNVDRNGSMKFDMGSTGTGYQVTGDLSNPVYIKTADMKASKVGAPAGYDSTPVGKDEDGTPMYKRTGAQTYKGELPKESDVYKSNIANLKSYVEKKGLGTNYDWNNEADQRRALQDVIRFNQTFEKAYMTGHTFPAGNTDSFRERVIEMIGRAPFYDEKGNIVSKDDLPALIEGMRKEKPAINGQATDFKTKQPVYSFQVGGKLYRVPMHMEMQQTLGAPNDMLNRAISNETGVFEYGPNKDLFINKMGPGGMPINMVVAGGGTQQYQQKANELYNSNVANLKEIGFSEQEAKEYLDKNYINIQEAINSDYETGFQAFNPSTGKTTTIKYAVGRQKEGSRRPTYKYFTNQLSPSPDLGRYIYDRMQEFGGGKNPGMNMLGFDVYPQKDRAAMFKGITADDDYGLENDE